MAFSAKTLDFLFENRLQDSRDWFLDHKDTYQTAGADEGSGTVAHTGNAGN